MSSQDIRDTYAQLLETQQRESQILDELHVLIPNDLICKIIKARGWSTHQASCFRLYLKDDIITARWEESHCGETDYMRIEFPISIIDAEDQDAAIQQHADALKEAERLEKEQKEAARAEERKASVW